MVLGAIFSQHNCFFHFKFFIKMKWLASGSGVPKNTQARVHLNGSFYENFDKIKSVKGYEAVFQNHLANFCCCHVETVPSIFGATFLLCCSWEHRQFFRKTRLRGLNWNPQAHVLSNSLNTLFNLILCNTNIFILKIGSVKNIHFGRYLKPSVAVYSVLYHVIMLTNYLSLISQR